MMEVIRQFRFFVKKITQLLFRGKEVGFKEENVMVFSISTHEIYTCVQFVAVYARFFKVFNLFKINFLTWEEVQFFKKKLKKYLV